jgi:hypothetical protein
MNNALDGKPRSFLYTEIERQWKAIKKLEECNEYLLGRVLENNQLITELADALSFGHHHFQNPESAEWCSACKLIQKAREVVK